MAFGTDPTLTGGMTLRDWFAGQAIAALVRKDSYAREKALDAYRIADAMLAERERQS